MFAYWYFNILISSNPHPGYSYINFDYLHLCMYVKGPMWQFYHILDNITLLWIDIPQ